MTVALSAGILGALAFAALLAAFHHNRKPELPAEAMEPLVKPYGKFILCCPCNSKLSLSANQIATKHYGSEGIPFERYEQWRLKNKQILVCLLDDSREVVGYFDILPLRSSFVDAFLSGRVVESQIGPDDILAPQHGTRCQRLYLGGIAVYDPRSHKGKRHADMLVWGLLKYIRYYYSLNRDRKLYAVASSAAGERLLKNFGFTVSCPSSARLDSHNMYALTLTDEILSEALRSRPDFSTLCAVEWETAGRRPQRSATTGS
jgi:hypothetical protein